MNRLDTDIATKTEKRSVGTVKTKKVGGTTQSKVVKLASKREKISVGKKVPMVKTKKVKAPLAA